LARLATLPRVTAAAVAFRAPLSLSGGGLAKPVLIPGRPLAAGEAPPSVKFNAVSRDYFKVTGTPLVAGRLFDATDEQPGEPVVVVNQEFARRFFWDGNALGSTIQFKSRSEPPHRIVGIVKNAVINQLTEEPEPYFYLPYWRASYGEATFLVQASSDAAGLAPLVRAALKQVDPDLEPRRVITMRQFIDYWSSDRRATALLASALGGIGLLLTIVGVYGVVAYRTARRGREIGIRMALGATRAQVVRLIVREGVTVALAGVALGIPAAIVAARATRSFLYGVTPWDVPALAGSSAVLVVCVCAAAAYPARRATRIEPSKALRTS
jgi:predicted permease